MQVNNGIDPDLRTLGTPELNSIILWQDLIDMAKKFDKAQLHSKHTRN